MTQTLGDREGSYAAGRRRYLTVLFSDLSDSTRLGGAMEAEHYSEMLSEFRSLCRSIIPKHGGLIARIQGDGVLAIFGYPEAGEGDGRRATEAALELHAAVERLSVDVGLAPAESLALHSGIHSGLAFLADGDVERGRFEVLGDVPNAAARLSDLAERGDIYVSEETLGPETNFFATGERRLVSLQGRGPALAIYRVLGRAPIGRRFEALALRGLAPFVGRDAEMALLRACLAAAAGGTPQCLAVSGGPGLGKTRLIEEFLLQVDATQSTILKGYCESYLSAEPLQPFLQMLRAVCGLERGMSSTQPADSMERALVSLQLDGSAARDALEQALPLVSGGSEARQPSAGGAVAALRGIFDLISAQRPLLLVLDDWQWADDASQQVLDAIRTLDRPIAVLIATRGTSADGFVARDVETIELAPLSLEKSRETMARLLPGADPFVVAEIHRYAGGNPLFIEELCHSAAAAPSFASFEGHHGGAAWLDALIESRFMRLPPDQADLVRAAAVIGNVFPAWVLERIAGHGEDAPLVRALAQQDFLFPSEQPGMLRFKHGITRDVIYDAIGLHERRALHLRIAAALDAHGADVAREDIYEALAYHYAIGGRVQEAARYAELAGDKAMSAFALDRARIQYSAALSALDRLPRLSRDVQLQWCTVAQKLGMACVFDPLALADGVAIFERGVALARQADDLEAIARAEYWLGYIYYAKGRAREATAHCESSLELSTRLGDQRLAAQVRATLGQALHAAAEYDRALILLDTAIDSKRARGKPASSLAVGSAYALACKGAILADRGFFDHADECFSEALELLGGTVHQVVSSVRNWIGAAYQWQGRWEEAIATQEVAIQVAEHVKSRQLLAMARALWGHASWMVTQREADMQVVREATSWIEARKGALVTSLNYGWLIEGAVSMGRCAEARRHAARLFLRARQHDQLGAAMGCRALALAAAKANDPARAEHYLTLAMRAAEARQSPHEAAVTQLCRAEIDIGRGHPQQARGSLDAACEAFAAMGMHWHLRRAHLLQSTR